MRVSVSAIGGPIRGGLPIGRNQIGCRTPIELSRKRLRPARISRQCVNWTAPNKINGLQAVN
jgi:hypothetical protein